MTPQGLFLGRVGRRPEAVAIHPIHNGSLVLGAQANVRRHNQPRSWKHDAWSRCAENSRSMATNKRFFQTQRAVHLIISVRRVEIPRLDSRPRQRARQHAGLGTVGVDHIGAAPRPPADAAAKMTADPPRAVRWRCAGRACGRRGAGKVGPVPVVPGCRARWSRLGAFPRPAAPGENGKPARRAGTRRPAPARRPAGRATVVRRGGSSYGFARWWVGEHRA